MYNVFMDELKINSRSYFLWNNSTGTAIAEKNSAVQTPVASLTKIMTALLAVELRDLDEVVEIMPGMLQGLEGFAVLGLRSGQTLTVRELVFATLLPSAGDAAQALAISTGGSIAEFADLMNKRAAEIGMTNTHFSNSVGFDEDNYSTPQDIAILLMTALQNPIFVEFFESYTAELPSVQTTVAKTFARQGYIKGGKTGFTNAAGRCLASTADIEGAEYILVTVGAELGENVTDANKIYRYVADNYEPVQILEAGTTLLEIPAEQSETRAISYTAEDDVVVTLQNDTNLEDLTYKYEGETAITRQTEEGTKLGTYEILQGDDLLYTQEVYYTEAPEFYNYGCLIAGGLGSLVLLGLTAWLLWRKHHKAAIVGVMIFLASLVANYLAFGSWFEPRADLVVYRPKTDTSTSPAIEKETNKVDLIAGIGLASNNCTTQNGNLMLINPNFTVDTSFIQGRREQLISVSQTYGIQEYHFQGNGDNLMIPEAAEHLNEMLQAYSAANPGHEMGTYSCFRARGTSCGRLCAATGASDHHTGLTCDLIDLEYGTVLDTDDYEDHMEWQWLKENSYRYGFIDRFPEAWAGGSMLEPLNVDEHGSTGLYETWHYRYVGVVAATEIALGKYNNGQYDSLEHYLKAVGGVSDLKNGLCTAQ